MQKLFLAVCVLFWNYDSYASVSSSSQAGIQEIKINNVVVTVSNEIITLIEKHASAIEAQFNSDPAHHMICFDYRKLMCEIYCNVTTYVDVECVLLNPKLFISQPDTDRHLLYDSCMEYILEEFDKFLELWKPCNFLFYVDDTFIQCLKKIPLNQLFRCCLGIINATNSDCFMFKCLVNGFAPLCDQAFVAQKNLPAYQHINSYFEIKDVCSDISDQKLCNIVVKKLVAIEQQQGKKLFLGGNVKGFCGSIMSFKKRFVDCYDAYVDALAEQYGVSQGLSAQYPKSLVMSCFVEDGSLPKDSETIESMIIESMEAELIYFQKNKQLLPKTLKILQTPLLIHGGSVQAVESSSVTDPLIQSSGMSYAFIKSCTQTMLDENVPLPGRKEALIVLYTALFNQKFNSYDSELPEFKINFNYEKMLRRLFDDLELHIRHLSAIMNPPTKTLSPITTESISRHNDNDCIGIMCQALFVLHTNLFDSLQQSKCLSLLTDNFMQCFQQLFEKTVSIIHSKSISIITRLELNSKHFLDNCIKAINDQLLNPEYRHIEQCLRSAFDRSKNAANPDKEVVDPDKEVVNRLQKLILEFKSNINSKSSDKIRFNCDALISNLCSKMPEKIQEFFKTSKFVLARSAPEGFSELMNMSMVYVLDSVFMQVLNKENLMLIDDNFIQCINAELLTGCFVTMNLNGENFDFALNEKMFHANCIKAFENQMQKPEYQSVVRPLKPVSRAGENVFNPSKDAVKQFKELISKLISDIEIKLSGKIKFNYLNLFFNLCINMSEKIQERLNSFNFYYNKSDTTELYICMNQSMLNALHKFFIQVLNKENLRLVDDNFIQCINTELLTGCFVVIKDKNPLCFSFNEPMFVANCTKAFENQMHHYEEQYRVRCKELSALKSVQDDSCFDIAVKMLVGIEAVQNFKKIFDCNDLVRLREETFYRYEKSDPSAYSSYIESLKKQYNLEHGLSGQYPKSLTIPKSIIDETRISSSDNTSLLQLLKESLDKHNETYRTIVQKLAKLRENTALGSTTKQGAQQVSQPLLDALKCESRSPVDTVVSAASSQESVKPELPPVALSSSEPVPQSWISAKETSHALQSFKVEDPQKSTRLTDVEINQKLLLIQLAEMEARVALQQDAPERFIHNGMK